MTATSGAGYTPAYTLDNQWRAARERLECLEVACDPVTAGDLDRVGVGAGWHCLEVGAGAGSVVRMLCERVGPDGRVLAVDLEPALLEGLEAPNLEVRRLDVVTAELPEAAFDLVHTRAVLMHIPQREELIPKLIRTLRPGGAVLFEEMDLTPAFQAPDERYRRTMETMYRPLRDAGLDLFWASRLSDRVDGFGLVDTGSARHPMPFTGRSVMAEFFRLTWLEFLEKWPYTDEERAIIEAGREQLAQPGGDYVAWDVVAVWGRRP